IVAEDYGIPLEQVMILHGDTDSTPEGRGTYGSRTTAVGGSAVYTAAQRLKASADDITLEDGKFSVSGSPQKSVGFNDVALSANLSNTLQPGIEPGLETTVFWEPEACVFPFGSHICAVEVDRDTGEARIMRYVAVDDCGRQLNPLIIE